MTKIKLELEEIESLKRKLEEKKQTVSDLLENLKGKFKETSKKFKWNDRWFQIKKRAGRNFIIDFGDKEPGSWRKKKE